MESDKNQLSPDVLFFFDDHLSSLPIYEALSGVIFSRWPDADLRVQKSQITFSHRHVFACVSFLRVKPKAQLPEGYLVLTLGLPYPLDSPRIAAKTEPYPGRWTTHIVLSRPDDLDDELLEWLTRAHDFAFSK